MARGYGQYCPLALAAELLAQRWTILVISRVLGGCTTFSSIHRGVPRISPSLLSQRLGELEDAGILAKTPRRNGAGHNYSLTPAGSDLAGVIEAMAIWGQHWARDMVSEDLDPGFLAWSMHTRLHVEAMPAGRVVIEFSFSGAPEDCRRFWLVKESAEVDMCLRHPGFESDLVVRSDLKRFVEVWRGFRDLREEIRAGRVRLEGSSAMRRDFPSWLGYHVLAGMARKRRGPEQRRFERTREGARPPVGSDS